ncbi:MAG TPA: zinc-binding dehydrogenase [Candidatus Acidoferrum sp.]|nr:zinc-binding dehydrogenase [Candidatus Acidoferrum sp.]
MRTMLIGRYGPPEVFEVRESPDPTPKPGEALVRVHAVGVGFADLMQRMGAYPDTPKAPFVPGLEVAGVVERAPTRSSGNEQLQVGERVLALPKFSGYAERVAAPAERVFRLPTGISFEEAAAMPVNYLTAYHIMFVMGNLQPGDRILVHGVAGGVGGAVVQLAKARNLKVFGTASPAKQEYIRKIGVDHPIDYTREDFVDVVRRAVPEGIEMVMDPIGGKSFTKSYRCLGPMGRLVIFGFSAATGSDGKRSLWRAAKAYVATRRYHPLKLMGDNIAIIGVHLGHLDTRGAILAKELGELFSLYNAGIIKPVIGKTFPLEEAAAAHRYVHNSQHVGKVVLRVP